MESKAPLLTHSAILYPNGEVVIGRRHSDVIALQSQFGIKTIGDYPQGFMDNTGKFYTRAEARDLAAVNGQLPDGHKGVLYSEDLWQGPIVERED